MRHSPKSRDFELDLVNEDMTLYAKWIDETNFTQTFKVLSIGNSFSEDAHRFLWSIAQSYGIAPENIIIANFSTSAVAAWLRM
ncbi:MAG: hypothetical protein MZU97_21060 [Bacillus subtilis]|nr:hypothetical protein [Bacillus subtilis]